jgi:hypothetical protein
MPTQRAARWKLPLWSSSLACRTSYAPDLRSSTEDQLSKQDRERTGGEISEPPRDGFPAIEVDLLQQLMRGSPARPSAGTRARLRRPQPMSRTRSSPGSSTRASMSAHAANFPRRVVWRYIEKEVRGIALASRQHWPAAAASSSVGNCQRREQQSAGPRWRAGRGRLSGRPWAYGDPARLLSHPKRHPVRPGGAVGPGSLLCQGRRDGRSGTLGREIC